MRTATTSPTRNIIQPGASGTASSVDNWVLGCIFRTSPCGSCERACSQRSNGEVGLLRPEPERGCPGRTTDYLEGDAAAHEDHPRFVVAQGERRGARLVGEAR